MKKQRELYVYKASTKDYLLALANFPNFVKKLACEGRPYQKLVEYLLEHEVQLLNEDAHMPSMKDLSVRLNIQVGKLSAHLKLIYEEILSLNQSKPNLFVMEGDIPCHFSFKYFDSFQTFTLGLKMVPGKGERFDFYFIKPKLGISLFHVERVYHDFENDGHHIMLSLSTDYPNQYLELLKEKAYLRGEISFSELIGLDKDSEMEEKLLKWNRSL
jgi:hypothetical protein